MSETHTFSIPIGAGRVALILSPERVQLGHRHILTSDVKWIRLDGYRTKFQVGGYNFGVLPSVAVIEIGNPSTKISIEIPSSAEGLGLSTTNAQLFWEIYSGIMDLLARWILREMVEAIARGETLTIGKLRFSMSGVEMPTTKMLFFSGEPRTVPWERVTCSGEAQGAANLADSSDSNVHGSEFFSVPNGCLIELLVVFMRGPWRVTRGDKHKMGPFSWPQLLQMVSSGLLQPADRVLQEGAEISSAADAIPGLFSEK